MKTLLNENFEQPHDPAKGAQRIVDLVRGDLPDNLRGKRVPARIALGDDAYGSIKDVYGSRLKENDEWKEWICGTAFDT